MNKIFTKSQLNLILEDTMKKNGLINESVEKEIETPEVVETINESKIEETPVKLTEELNRFKSIINYKN